MNQNSIGGIDIRKEIDEIPWTVFSARKVRLGIVARYGLQLDQHEEHSLSSQIAVVLSEMCEVGKLSIYRGSGTHRPIRYTRTKTNRYNTGVNIYSD